MAGPRGRAARRARWCAHKPVGAGTGVLVQPSQILVLVPERLVRLAAALADPLGKLDHLVDRLLTVEPHDVVEDHLAEGVLGLARLTGQDLDEHGDHHLGPALADQRQRPVEVEQDMADLGARLQWLGQLDVHKRWSPAHGSLIAHRARHETKNPAVVGWVKPTRIGGRFLVGFTHPTGFSDSLLVNVVRPSVHTTASITNDTSIVIAAVRR